MDPIEPYRAMARYNRWMNESLYRVAAQLTEEERRRDLGAFFRSVHGTFNHILLADSAWMRRIAEDPEPYRLLDAAGEPIRITGLDQELYADFDELGRVRARIDAAMAAWIDALAPEDLDREVRYRTMDGSGYGHPLWWAVTHMLNHGTHHRGQVTTLLKQLGRDPGVTDLMIMLRDEAAA